MRLTAVAAPDAPAGLVDLARRAGARPIVEFGTASSAQPRPPAAPGSDHDDHDYAQLWHWPIEDDWLATVAQYSKRLMPPDGASRASLVAHRSAAMGAVAAFEECDLAIGMGSGAIAALLVAASPYVAVEWGDNVDDDGIADPALEAAYRAAGAVVVTDANRYWQLSSAGWTNLRYLGAPLDPTLWRPRDPAPTGAGRSIGVFIPDVIPLGAVSIVHEGRDLLAEARPETSVEVVLVDHGERSDPIRDWVASYPEVSLVRVEDEARLAELYAGAGLIFACEVSASAIDATVSRAAAIGRPVMSLLDAAGMGVTYGEAPPVPVVSTVTEFAATFNDLCGPAGNAGVADLAGWFARNHSVEALAARLQAIAVDAFDNAGGSSLVSLRQKRWELVYESGSAAGYDAKYHDGVAYQRMDRSLAELLASSLDESARGHPRVLDLGCGPGSMVPYLAEIDGVEIVGVDLSPEMIAFACQRYPGVQFDVGDAEVVDFADDTFDAVLISGVLHHLPDPIPVVEEVRRVLKPGGVLVAREPNAENFSARHGKAAFTHLCLRHHLHFAAGTAPASEPDPHEDHRDLDPLQLVRLLGTQLAVERVHTDMRVSYFYDMILDEADYQPITQLEATLGNQPGLNLVVVGRKAATVGASPEVIKSLVDLGRREPVQIDHLEHLADAIERYAAEAAAAGEPRPDQLAESGWEAIAARLRPDAAVAAIGAQPATSAPVSGGAVIPFAEVGEVEVRSLDAVAIVVDEAITEAALAAAIERCRDYGWVYLEVGPHGSVSGPADDRLANLPVMAGLHGSGGWRIRGVLSPTTHTPLDAWIALQSYLDDQIGAVNELYGARFAALRERARTAIAMGTFARSYSAMRAVGTGSVVRRLLDPATTS